MLFENRKKLAVQAHGRTLAEHLEPTLCNSSEATVADEACSRGAAIGRVAARIDGNIIDWVWPVSR